ncbi:large ribosomal subunit protein mL48 [Malaya genurostris]|uniref:large ribosomal subunit protein mL48 n=1 Tax=Malaya genurostris TaxID=325434 RepID=UPI0026F39D0A|nr:large ribosomal subunit protein mL48 [Malaya genurostris]
MALRQIIRRLVTGRSKRPFSSGSMYEPAYLELLRPKYPVYNTLNFNIKGYDYAILESYQRFIYNVSDTMELDTVDCWAHPPKKLNVQRFKPASAVIDSEYKLTVYERNVQIANLQSPLYPIFVRILQAALPEGVTLSVSEHSDDVDEARYVPDKDLLELKQQLDDMGGSRDRK